LISERQTVTVLVIIHNEIVSSLSSLPSKVWSLTVFAPFLLILSHRCFPPSFGHLAKQLQRRKYLEIDQSEIRMACGGHVY
jgi:hypothetical protein